MAYAGEAHIGASPTPGSGWVSNPWDVAQATAQKAKDSLASISASLSTPSISSIYTPPATVYAPKLDVAGINATARQKATGAVSPYYQKVLDQYLAQEAEAKRQKQVQTETNIKNYEDTLNQTLEGNATTKTRTGEDVATNMANVNTQADQFQTDAGTQTDAERLALARTASTGGLGAQTQETAQSTKNTAEKRQEQQFQQSRDAQQLFKSRTFEDLAKSGELATITKEKGVKQSRFDLESYVTNLGLDEQSKRNDLEGLKQEAINNSAKQYSLDAYNEYIRNITNPAQRLAASQQYGGSF